MITHISQASFIVLTCSSKKNVVSQDNGAAFISSSDKIVVEEKSLLTNEPFMLLSFV